MADYTSDIISARASIAEAGLMCKLVRAGNDDLDVPALLTAYARSELGFQDTSGQLILATDRKALIPGGLSRNPDSELDKFEIPVCDVYPNGDTVRIVIAKPLAVNGQAIIWELQLRK
jgi:hypothetical protein